MTQMRSEQHGMWNRRDPFCHRICRWDSMYTVQSTTQRSLRWFKFDLAIFFTKFKCFVDQLTDLGIKCVSYYYYYSHGLYIHIYLHWNQSRFLLHTLVRPSELKANTFVGYLSSFADTERETSRQLNAIDNESYIFRKMGLPFTSCMFSCVSAASNSNPRLAKCTWFGINIQRCSYFFIFLRF